MTARFSKWQVLVALAAAAPAFAGEPPLLAPGHGAAIAEELSGEAAKRTVETFSLQHRMRGSRGFRAAAEHVAAELRRYGLSNVEIVEIPADGTTFYGTQLSRRPWDAEFAELWELEERDGLWQPATRWASWDSEPLHLAQDSESADVVAELVDVGAGSEEKDYAGRDVRGKIVLVSAQAESVVPLAVDRFGAAGIVSYAQNQRTAWWGEDENLVRWGHVGSFNPHPTFAFMVSLKRARAFQRRLAAGESIRLHAVVRAGQHSGHYDVVTATIPGAGEAAGQEIVYSCHLDHPRPGANDNASGCATILEIARSLSKLVKEGKLPPPARTLRFVFPPEIEGTLALLNFRPEWTARVKAAIHLDMVGGGPVTKAVFHVTRGPASLPSFVHDVAAEFGEFVNRESLALASGEQPGFALNAPTGGKEALQAEFSDYSAGSDHDVYQDSSFSIPAIYLNDWPDRYIHTNFDLPANVDPTKLRRAGFIAAASGWVLANLAARDVPAIVGLLERQALRRAAGTLERRGGLAPGDATISSRFALAYEQATVDSLDRFLGTAGGARKSAAFLERLPAILGDPSQLRLPPSRDGLMVYRRNPAIKGPVSVFGYDYLDDHLGKDRAAGLKLPARDAGHGAHYAYDALNLVDGRRSAAEIRDTLSAIYGPVPLEEVTEYLRALAEVELVAPTGGTGY